MWHLGQSDWIWIIIFDTNSNNFIFNIAYSYTVSLFQHNDNLFYKEWVFVWMLVCQVIIMCHYNDKRLVNYASKSLLQQKKKYSFTKGKSEGVEA